MIVRIVRRENHGCIEGRKRGGRVPVCGGAGMLVFVDSAMLRAMAQVDAWSSQRQSRD